MPAGYGISKRAKGQLPWAWADERLGSSRNFWIVTASPGGRPHAMPVWGVWLDGSVFFSTDADSTKARNIARNPRIVVHLESGDEVVILEGRVGQVNKRSALERFADAYEQKYGFRFDLDEPIGLVYALRPRVVFGWREEDFPQSATRWRLGR